MGDRLCWVQGLGQPRCGRPAEYYLRNTADPYDMVLCCRQHLPEISWPGEPVSLIEFVP